MKPASIHFWRRLVQLGCALAFVAIPFLNRAEINVLAGNFLAFNFAGLPLADPLSALQVTLSSLSVDEVAMGGLISLGIAFVLGPVFCSWLCPYGLLSEWVHSLSRKILRKNRITPSAPLSPAEKQKSGMQGKKLMENPFIVRLSIVLVGLALAAAIVPFPLLNQLSMPGWYSRFWQHLPIATAMLWAGPVILLGMLLVELFTRKRLWCRYVCPQSVLISLSGLLLPARLQVAFKPRCCTCPANDRSCRAACSLELDPRQPTSLGQRVQCTNCGDCVDACRSRGRALGFGFGKAGKAEG
ncbi:4Fe-4S binding protein [Desulfosarcina sp. OttesenSCG-928-A07]|nr:4Fe-4S binding protein [Desulfosarcina sp. OttesenSCG-928-G17]MDL2328457.1 4Fe-4S binding protein [Desulfosarcina sp. OttesenSCG-928-A07]